MKKENVFLIIAVLIISILVFYSSTLVAGKATTFESLFLVVLVIFSIISFWYIYGWILTYAKNYKRIIFPILIIMAIPIALIVLLIGSFWIANVFYLLYIISDFIYVLFKYQKLLFYNYTWIFNFELYKIFLIISFILEIPYAIFLYVADRKSENSKAAKFFDKYKNR